MFDLGSYWPASDNFAGGILKALLAANFYFCINSARTKEVMVHYILQPHHIFIRVKVFILMLVPGGLQLLIISMCFAWRPVTSMIKSHVLIPHSQDNCYITACFLFIN